MCCPIFPLVFHIHSNASTNLKCVTLRFVNNVDMIMIVWTMNVVPNSFCLAIYYLSEIWSSVSTIPSLISLPTSTLYSFRDMAFLWPSNMLASGVNVISPRGLRVSGWTNPTLDPWASTNTFRVPKLTFIVTLLWCDVWYHQSTILVLIIDMISWSKD
jgi:hypothetical protein